MSRYDGATHKSACTYPIVIIEHSLRCGLYGGLAGLVLCSRPQYAFKVAKVTFLGAGWAYMAEYSKCSFADFIPWTADKGLTAWIPGCLAGVIAGSTVATAYRPALSPSHVATFTAFSAMTYAMNGYAEWRTDFQQYENGKKHHPHVHAFHGENHRT
jgi:hypothetical protein